MKRMKKRKPTSFRKDARRKHHHWQVKLFYSDGEQFSRMYTGHDKAEKFAVRQKKSPMVKRTLVRQIS
jgi:hypothetical protein